MQGQRSAIGSLPDSIHFDYGSRTRNVGVDQQICWNNLRNSAESSLSDFRISGVRSSSDTFMGGVSQVGRWSIGGSSSSNPHNVVSYDDCMTESGWPSSNNGSIEAGLRLEDHRYEPTNFISHTGVNLNLGRNPVVAGPSIVRNSMDEPASQNHDLDDANFHRVAEDKDCPNSSKCIDFENRFRVSSSSSSNILATSSGSGGLLVKEDEGRPGCSVDDMNYPNSTNCVDFENRFHVSSSSSSDILASSSGIGGFLVEKDEGRPGCSMDVMDCPNSSKCIDFENRFRVSSSSSSDILASSSGSGGFLVEEDEGRPGCSVDGRRLSCKRKTLEGNVGQSSSSESCFLRTTEGGMWHADPLCYDTSGNASISSESSSFFHTEQVNPRLGLGLGGNSADSFCPINMPGGPERSYRLRVNHSMQQDSVPNNSPSETSGARRSDSLTTHGHHSSRFVHMSPPLDLMSSTPSDSSVSQSQPVILRVPAPRRNMQAPRWNGALNLRPGSSSSSNVSGVRDAMLPEDLNSRNPSRNMTENPMLIPHVMARNPAQTSRHLSASSGNVGVSRHIASNSRSGSASASNTEPGSSWAPHRHPSSQYSRRLSEYVRRSLLSTVGSEHAGQGSNSQLRSGPVSSQEGMPSSSGNPGHNQSHARSALWIERQGDGAVGMPNSLRALAVGEGRSRLVSELRNVLDMMRRGDTLRFEVSF